MRVTTRKAAMLAVYGVVCATSMAPAVRAQEGPPAPSASVEKGVVARRKLPTLTPGPSITLAEALERAESRNLGMEAARLEIDKARAQLKQAWGLVLPVIQGGMQYTRMDHEDTLDLAGSMAPLLQAMGITLPPGAAEPMLLNPQDKLDATLQAGLSVVNAKSWFTINAAQAGVEFAELSVKDGQRRLLLGVAQAYYMALMARELIDLYTAQVEAAEAQVAVARARLSAEAGRRIDVVRAETDLEKVYQDLISAHLAFDNARDAIGSLTGTPGLPLPQHGPSFVPPDGTEAQLADRAGSRRTDIRAGRAKVTLQENLLDAVWMQFLPTLSAGWRGSYQFTQMPDMGSQDRSRWAFVLSLTVPIYDQFRYGDLDYKRAALQQATVELKNIEDKASLAVRNSARDYDAALLSIETAERQAALAGEGLALAESAYKAGAATSLDVTEARRGHTSASVNLATLRLRAQIALLTLLDAVGDDLLPPSRARPED
ncbi:MAG: TolC family protein [Deltaproteobacteria bacterium]|nr:TolC family protein [Deltaproteobacteria bacterium]